tara:strand:- start:1358 stop:2005 length:648 start_codon:yes stop_codon:yes gene_type:complete
MAERSREEIEKGRLLFARQCNFVLSCAQLSQVPDDKLPEVAFAGRSNVGKSSLINALVSMKALARTSKTPGRTQQINFFNLDHRLMIADLPGYGYARAPKRRIQEWNGMVETYLKGRVSMRRVFVLIDTRRGLKEMDRTILKMLDAAAQSYQIILTKCDKLKRGPVSVVYQDIGGELTTHGAAHPEIVLTSAHKGHGLAELRAEMAMLANPPHLG